MFQIHNHQMILKEQWNDTYFFDTNHYFLTALIGHFQKLRKGPAIGTEYENSKIFYCGKLMYLKSIFGNVINLSHSSYPHLIYKFHIIHFIIDTPVILFQNIYKMNEMFCELPNFKLPTSGSLV